MYLPSNFIFLYNFLLLSPHLLLHEDSRNFCYKEEKINDDFINMSSSKKKESRQKIAKHFTVTRTFQKNADESVDVPIPMTVRIQVTKDETETNFGPPEVIIIAPFLNPIIISFCVHYYYYYSSIVLQLTIDGKKSVESARAMGIHSLEKCTVPDGYTSTKNMMAIIAPKQLARLPELGASYLIL